jgi:hypothetical protein
LKDFAIVSLDSLGNERWVYIYNGPGNSTDEASSIMYGPDGNLYTTGGSSDVGTGTDIIVISLEDTLTTSIEEQRNPKIDYQTSNIEIYPNPSNGKTVIHYALSTMHYAEENKKVPTAYSPGLAPQGGAGLLPTIRIYNVAGRLVKDFSCPTHYALGSTHISWDGRDNKGRQLPNGVYFCRLEMNGKSLTASKPMIMLK